MGSRSGPPTSGTSATGTSWPTRRASSSSTRRAPGSPSGGPPTARTLRRPPATSRSSPTSSSTFQAYPSTGRIHVAGISNGGGMAFVLACELSDRMASIGTVAGLFTYPWEACDRTRPVPLIAFHGLADEIVRSGADPGRARRREHPATRHLDDGPGRSQRVRGGAAASPRRACSAAPVGRAVTRAPTSCSTCDRRRRPHVAGRRPPPRVHRRVHLAGDRCHDVGVLRGAPAVTAASDLGLPERHVEHPLWMRIAAMPPIHAEGPGG